MRHVIEAHKSGTPCFSCQYLLLSTIVLNDDMAASVWLSFVVKSATTIVVLYLCAQFCAPSRTCDENMSF